MRDEVPLAEASGFFPPDRAEVALAGTELVRAGGNAVLSPDVAEVLGRLPTSFGAWAASHRERFGVS
jgi:hypothetical protein